MAVFISLFMALNSAPAQGWTQTTAPAANSVSVASSADGSKLAALILDGGAVYTSTNSGTNWTWSSPGNNFYRLRSR